MTRSSKGIFGGSAEASRAGVSGVPGCHWRLERQCSGRRELSAASAPQLVSASLALWLGLLLAFMPGCASTLDLRLREGVQCPARSVFIFFVDGMDLQRTNELLAAGRLPNIRHRFVEQGVQVQHAISSLPSITYPNCSSTITGRFPGHHGILGNVWFDRSTLVGRDYTDYSTYLMVNDDLKVPTLYDLLKDRFTASIGHHTYRGVGLTLPNGELLVRSWIFGAYSAVDSGVVPAMQEVADVANRTGRWPSVIMTYYPGVDEIGHRTGTASPAYAEALENIDRIVGAITAALDKAGPGQSTTYVLMADHGMAPGSEAGESHVLRWLQRRRGLRMREQPVTDSDYRKRLAIMDRYDSFGFVDAGREAVVHLRGSHGWGSPVEPGEVLEWLKKEPAVYKRPAVQVALARGGPDRVCVFSEKGTAVLERKYEGGAVQYRIAECTGDPLGYLGSPELAAFVNAGWHGSREWLVATVHTRFPDFVPQAVEMFDSTRTGDIVLMAADGWLFSERGEHAGHGSCLARDMHIPLFFSGPDLPKGAQIDHGRLVDVMPTVLGLLGEADRLKAAGAIDGIDLAAKLRAARPRQ
jgi:hypothetical protein